MSEAHRTRLGLRDRRVSHPGFWVVAWFSAFIMVGGTLLSLPVSQRTGGSGASVGDAFFTATSAVTVTGLAVVDTGTTWSWFGEVVLMVLIQVGGLGIMTLAGFVGLSLSRRLGVRGGMLAGAEIGLSDLGVLRTLIRNLVVFVISAEAVAAVLLAVRFLTIGEPLGRSAHLGLFHAVSAFNNAGFSVLETGLEPYVGDWFVSLVVAAAFILGGLGFPVVFELARRWRKPRTWTLHTKVTLSLTALLLLGGTVLFAISEWSNAATIGSLPVDERLLASFFQSATTRTAGFNTVPTGELRSATWLLMIPLMVVGAGSASTGGGIKTSTMAVVIKSTMAEFRRDASTALFERHVPYDQQRQALALVVAALGTVGTAGFVLSVLHGDLDSLKLLFEAASAFGTVGLSADITPHLNSLGRLVIIVLMFIGRVGPITFGTAFLLRGERKRYGFAEETLLVG